MLVRKIIPASASISSTFYRFLCKLLQPIYGRRGFQLNSPPICKTAQSHLENG